jgi:2-polyprenyl-3-methyl-5-hydroxy-6-metoxy-1,4-benzoquinol methylase
MDDPDCRLDFLFNTYRQFVVVNSLFARWRTVYCRFIRPLMAPAGGHLRLLDIGVGGGDIPRRLLCWARADGCRLQVTAIDNDPRAIEYVRSKSWPAGISFRAATAGLLKSEGARFDCVICNNLLHHLDADACRELCDDADALAERLVLFSDIRRSPLAYILFALSAGPFFHRSFVVADGLTSIRRSYRPAELEACLPRGWTVQTLFPYRLLAVRQTAG